MRYKLIVGEWPHLWFHETLQKAKHSQCNFITEIWGSRVYQVAKMQDHLFSNPAELAAYAKDYEAFLPSRQTLAQLAEEIRQARYSQSS